MTAEERFIVFHCAGQQLVGVMHLPENPLPVGIVVIGRFGTHRSAVYFGRAAAARGIGVFRFDLRGRGDSDGPLVEVEEAGEDLRSAIRAFLEEASAIRRVVIWGLSEGATIALLHARVDARVAGLILVNPWIQVDHEVAKEHVRQNLSRILDPNFWNRIRNSEDGYRGAARSFVVLTRRWIETSIKRAASTEQSLKDKLMEALEVFPGPLQIILSGEDPASAIFQDAAKDRLEQLNREGRLTIQTEHEADHVFSRSDWRKRLIDWNLEWTIKNSPIEQ